MSDKAQIKALADMCERRGYVSPPRNPEDYGAAFTCQEALDLAAALRAQAARIAELEAALDSKHASVGHNIWRFWSDKACEMADKMVDARKDAQTARNDALREAAEWLRPQRNDVTATGEEFANALIYALIEGETDE